MTLRRDTGGTTQPLPMLLTVDEVAALLRLPRGTVATRLRRARMVFREQAKLLEPRAKGSDRDGS